MLVGSALLHLWGIRGDLPYGYMVDEPYFVDPAIRVSSGDTLDPGWAGHPGSTVIYPHALVLRLWYLVEGDPELLDADPEELAAIAASRLTPFFLSGRLISAAYGVACVALTWLIARRLTNGWAAVIGAAFVAVTAISIGHGRVTRTDTAGTFWALLSVWFVLRGVGGGRIRDFLFAAVAIGLAGSSRYFFGALAIPYLVGLAAAPLAGRPRSLRAAVAVAGGIIAAVVFAATSPYVFLEWDRTLGQLGFEARTVHPGADGLSPPGNLAWYVGTVWPRYAGGAALILATIGLVSAARDRRGPTLVLIAFVTAYLVAISASPLHWARYVIPVIPVFGVFMAAGCVAVARWLASSVAFALRRLEAGPRPAEDVRRGATILAGIVLATAVLLPRASESVEAARIGAVPSTRVAATEWIREHLPAGTRLGQEAYAAYLDRLPFDVRSPFSLSEVALDDYRAGGRNYLVTSSAVWARYTPGQHPQQTAWYAQLDASADIIKRFVPGPEIGGPEIRVYRLRTGPDS